MRVAGAQLDIVWEQPRANLERVDRLVQAAAEREAELVALPEMFATGFTMAAVEMAAHAGAIRAHLVELARRHRVWLVGGYSEPGLQRPYNACSLISPDGDELVHYRKIHPFSLAREPDYYNSGSAVFTVEAAGVRVTPLICYDLRFTELFRAVAARTDLFVVLANWPDRRSHAWRTLLAARAIDCQAWVLGVNRVGADGNGVDHRGDTSLVDPMGQVTATLAGREGLVVGDVDAARVGELRDRLPFLADRRPEVYRALEDGGGLEVEG